jgi:large subunit ribosomal protein L30
MPALKITLKKSLIGYKWDQRRTARALGLNKVGSSITQPDTAAIRGMVRQLIHVLDVESIEGEAPGPRPRTRRNAGETETV